MSKQWPKEYSNRTKDAFLDIDNSELKILDVTCMKNIDGRFGMIPNWAIHVKTFSIVDSDDKKIVYKYTTLDEMLNDGWVVD